MDRQDRCEVGASELSDDIEDTSIIGCLTDQAAKIRRMKLPVFAWRSSDQAVQLLLSRIKEGSDAGEGRIVRYGLVLGPARCKVL